MSENNRPQVVRSYLSQLEAALDGVPRQARRAILDGAAEELAGLDAAASAKRTEELGDSEFIAATARAEAGEVTGGVASSAVSPATISASPTTSGDVRSLAAPAEGRRAGDARWYIVLASMLVAFGGVIVPLLGWVFGLAMVWASKSWRLWEKWVATLTPPLTVSIYVVALWLLRVAGVGSVSNSDPTQHEVQLPFFVDSWWSYTVLLIALNVAVGIWLLWRGLRASSRVTQPGR